ncbi:hypothetical protein ACFQGA_07505 [Marinobacter koreensis]|uniref:hypothetical protein n=1 Tax=Marinobacter koreensis TaxID=335974 RepID=UPI00360691D9
MYTVSIIGFDGALASAVTGIIDLFRLAGVTWARIHGDEPQPWFRTRLLTRDGEPCKCINGLTLVSDGAWNEPDRDDSDLIIIPTIGAPIEKVLAGNSQLIEWLGNFRTRETPNVHVASNCTGAFFSPKLACSMAGRRRPTGDSATSFGSVTRLCSFIRKSW